MTQRVLKSWRGTLSKVTLKALWSLMKQQWFRIPFVCFVKSASSRQEMESSSSWLTVAIMVHNAFPLKLSCVSLDEFWKVWPHLETHHAFLSAMALSCFVCPSFPSLKSQACRTRVSLESRNGTNALRLESKGFVAEACETMWNHIGIYSRSCVMLCLTSCWLDEGCNYMK